MEDIFNTDFTTEINSQPPKITKDEFIQKTRSMLQAIMEEYSRSWKNKYNEVDDETGENTCSRCGGFTQIEQGGETIDCTSCNGTGINYERVFDSETFLDFMEHNVIFGEQPFLDLLHCDIVDM